MLTNFLGISWVHGRFQAVVAGGEACSWVSPTPVVQEAEFATALAEAVRQTGFRGHRVVIVLDHRNLLFHVQETPPAQGRLLVQLLDRLVGQNRFFEEKAAWSRVELPAVKGKQRHLLALLPESLIVGLKAACQAQRLQLGGVFPVAAAVGTQLRKISGAKDEVVVLASDVGGSLQLLLGRLDGQILFSRSVVLAVGPHAERTVQEINRTLHYAQQQFGVAVSRLIVFGEQTFQGLKQKEIRQGLTVELSPVAEDPLYFARVVEELSTRHPLNLVSQKQNRARLVRRLAAAAVVLALAGTGLTVVRVEQTVAAREALATAQERELDKQTEDQTQTIARQQEARRLAAFIALADPTNHPPVPEILTRYLSTCVPEAMRLGELSVTRRTNGWEFSLRGFVEEPPGGILPVLERFERELESSLFQARILDGTRQRVFRGGSEARQASAGSGARSSEKAFFVIGVIE